MISVCHHRLAILVVGALSCAAQDPEPTVFRSGATLIEFNMVALDSQGKPVTDLKKDEILIDEAGKRRDIAFFRFEMNSGTEAMERLTAGDFSNRTERLPSLRRNICAIALDTINTAPVSGGFGRLQESNYQQTTRAQLLRYLHAVPANTKVALYRMENDRTTVLRDFTDDVGSLRTSIAQIDLNARGPQIDVGFGDSVTPTGETAAGATAAAAADAQRSLSAYNEGIRDDRLRMSLAALEALGEHIAGLPGRKSILWMSVGMPAMTHNDGWVKSNAAAIQQTARRLATKGIAIYGVPTIAGAQYNPVMDVLADTTGGRVVRTINDPTEALTAAAADNSAVYSVAFYSAAEPDNKWHDVSLKVTRPGVNLKYRQGYFSETPAVQSQEWSQEQWRGAIYNSLGSSGLRLDARCHLGSGSSAGMVFTAIRFELTDLLFRSDGNRKSAQIEIAYVELKPDQTYKIEKRSATLGYTEANGGSVQNAHNWKLDPGANAIRIILRDKLTGRYGAVDIPIDKIPVQ